LFNQLLSNTMEAMDSQDVPQIWHCFCVAELYFGIWLSSWHARD